MAAPAAPQRATAGPRSCAPSPLRRRSGSRRSARLGWSGGRRGGQVPSAALGAVAGELLLLAGCAIFCRGALDAAWSLLSQGLRSLDRMQGMYRTAFVGDRAEHERPRVARPDPALARAPRRSATSRPWWSTTARTTTRLSTCAASGPPCGSGTGPQLRVRQSRQPGDRAVAQRARGPRQQRHAARSTVPRGARRRPRRASGGGLRRGQDAPLRRPLRDRRRRGRDQLERRRSPARPRTTGSRPVRLAQRDLRRLCRGRRLPARGPRVGGPLRRGLLRLPRGHRLELPGPAARLLVPLRARRPRLPRRRRRRRGGWATSRRSYCAATSSRSS